MFTIYSLTYAVWYGILYIELRERTREKTLTNKNLKLQRCNRKEKIMKINGTEIKGIKNAVGRYNKYKNLYEPIMIIFDNIMNTVECVTVKWYFNNQERMPNGYLRYDDISDLLKEVYGMECEPTMTNIQAILREYVI